VLKNKRIFICNVTIHDQHNKRKQKSSYVTRYFTCQSPIHQLRRKIATDQLTDERMTRLNRIQWNILLPTTLLSKLTWTCAFKVKSLGGAIWSSLFRVAQATGAYLPTQDHHLLNLTINTGSANPSQSPVVN
jgi:hypothetical protein